MIPVRDIGEDPILLFVGDLIVLDLVLKLLCVIAISNDCHHTLDCLIDKRLNLLQLDYQILVLLTLLQTVNIDAFPVHPNVT